jgi:hypothetical protein
MRKKTDREKSIALGAELLAIVNRSIRHRANDANLLTLELLEGCFVDALREVRFRKKLLAPKK